MEKTMDKIVALAKARGFIYPGSEIYGGLANTWDYGNLGVELKNNVKQAWWKKFIRENPYNVGIDCAILMNPQTWVASGHLGSFSDPLMDCKECHERFRADKVIEDSIALKETKASDGPTAVSASITAVSFPNEGIWASSFDVELIERIGDFLAEDARLNGVDTMYAPGVNIHRTPFGGRAHEYFSEDPLLTAYAAMAEVKGMQKKGVIPVLKHYAFNDEESARNGIGIWLNEQAAREIYLLPFEYAMRPSMGAGALGAMSSFNRVGALWTGASKALQLDISRNEWNFQGYFITDMASSNGALFMTFDDGVFNGTDLFLGSGSKTALKEWKSNIPFRNRVREAVHRVLYVTVNGNAVMNGVSPSSQVVLVTPWWAVALLAAIAASAVIALGSVVVHIWFILKDKRSKA